MFAPDGAASTRQLAELRREATRRNAWFKEGQPIALGPVSPGQISG